ncbi:dynein heavy chain 2 [Dorcoceras hygrometricum]|uniref:Dynein heavy chain 2 n=1 Tax=Dorcoceras hygrometricum TaxID=472368 RepID=A0A2Z7DFF8_9LAMI|nr:dynein heavy chain 2 [Dorcoceras hygrometricum]
MQHDIINAMKCVRAIKDRIARPASQLAIKSIKPLYHAQQVSRWKSSVRDLQGPSTHHSSVVDTRIRSMIALYFSGTTTQSASHNVALNKTSLELKSKSRNQLKNYRVPLDREFEQLRDPLQGRSTASTGYQSKDQVSGIPAPPKSLKSSAEI